MWQKGRIRLMDQGMLALAVEKSPCMPQDAISASPARNSRWSSGDGRNPLPQCGLVLPAHVPGYAAVSHSRVRYRWSAHSARSDRQRSGRASYSRPVYPTRARTCARHAACQASTSAFVGRAASANGRRRSNSS